MAYTSCPKKVTLTNRIRVFFFSLEAMPAMRSSRAINPGGKNEVLQPTIRIEKTRLLKIFIIYQLERLNWPFSESNVTR